MSVQFGAWTLDKEDRDPLWPDRAISLFEPFGRDGMSSYRKPGISINYGAFHSSSESHMAPQPFVHADGNVVTLDGRIDNRAELIDELGLNPRDTHADVELAAAAYRRWRTDSFKRLLGDWAFVIWESKARCLTLAKDFLGVRPLYYRFTDGAIYWSSLLEALVTADDKFALCEEYLAGWISSFPAAHLTPFVGLLSVPPSTYVTFIPGSTSVRKYWEVASERKLRYRSDAEYEEHFRFLFRQAVARRLRSHHPVLAELSGGMDSSSIVCVADALMGTASALTPRLDTVSYFNEYEPNWDERPFFTKVEEKLGRTGGHIEVSADDATVLPQTASCVATPASSFRLTRAQRQLQGLVARNGNRVLLSGIGGDEFLGGVPTPIPELADFLAAFELSMFAKALRAWSLASKRPALRLVFEVLRRFLPGGFHRDLRPAPWLRADFVRNHKAALTGYESRLSLFASPPHVQHCVSTLADLQRQIAAEPLSPEPLLEKRYPYLDRDLLEFLFAIPRQQLLRPGQRRSLMRRALVGWVPQEILDRRRKAFVVRTPMAALGRDWKLNWDQQTMHMERLGIVDASRFRDAIRMVCQGREAPIVGLMRTLAVEAWLGSDSIRQLLELSTGASLPDQSPSVGRNTRFNPKGLSASRM